MFLKLKHYSPLLIAIIVLWVTLTLFLNASLSLNNGKFVYALDDAYIHTAMAKNFAKHGVWGVTKHEFTSSSSSLLWTLLLACLYALLGVNEAIPLLLNFLTATLLLLLIFHILKKLKFTPTMQTLILTAFIIFIPLPHLVLGGLEHILQIIINIFYIYAAARVISDNSRPNTLFLLAPLVVMIRFEGLFIIFAVSLLLLTRKKYFDSFINGLTGILPVVVYGVISMLKGWHFLPNSVLLKGQRPADGIIGILEFIYSGLRQMLYNVHLFVLLITVLAILWYLYKKYDPLWNIPNTTGIIFAVVLACQMFFAKSGFFMNRFPQIRYDAYLTALGLLAVVIALGYPLKTRHTTQEKTRTPLKKMPEKILIGVLAFVLLLPLAERGVRTNLRSVRATANVYGQQYQVGLFLKKYYHRQTVAVNDIGAVTFLADFRCFDVWGLVSREIGDLKLDNIYTPENIDRVVRASGARIAVVYDQFIRLTGFQGELPPGWIKVGQWRIPNNVACARPTVSFFALYETEVPYLAKSLREFADTLPPEVKRESLNR
ncbi:MAG: hypothetical protein GY950_32550 [bacterium]|nr:hypothetical protein [bacterium]